LGKNRFNEQMAALDALIEENVIDDVLGVVKSGKEATVYLCSAPDGERGDYLVAAKVYRSRNVRQFADAAVYGGGRLRGEESRTARAIEQKSRFGRETAFGKWVSAEYETLNLLHAAGADVPRPIWRAESIIIMEYLGDADAPAPMLANVRPAAGELRPLFERVMRNIELMLANDRVHGDLSPFNVLYLDGKLRLIDFPQAVDPRFNENAQELLRRDVENMCAYFGRLGLAENGDRIARDLWRRFLRSDL
jgi:RIO kinase 1